MGKTKMTKHVEFIPDIRSVTAVTATTEGLSTLSRSALQEAREFILFYDWVSSIEAEFVGVCVDGILYAFLFNILPSREEVDKWVWVIVGDVPPAYITCESAKNSYEALDAYVGAMEEWVHAAQNGYPVNSVIPVNVDATPENALLLKTRLEFIDRRILPTLKRA
jgi:hypothetical protein